MPVGCAWRGENNLHVHGEDARAEKQSPFAPTLRRSRRIREKLDALEEDGEASTAPARLRRSPRVHKHLDALQHAANLEAAARHATSQAAQKMRLTASRELRRSSEAEPKTPAAPLSTSVCDDKTMATMGMKQLVAAVHPRDPVGIPVHVHVHVVCRRAQRRFVPPLVVYPIKEEAQGPSEEPADSWFTGLIEAVHQLLGCRVAP